ncbi:AAA family ATPase [Vibrio harveyi]|uniref:AAA family ATPase n=1 Tax=Vibrio harveyi TaxID=669 RepID=UPI003908CDBE
MSFTIEIPIVDGVKCIEIQNGSSVMIVGANGSGKTRLATYVEEKIGDKAHRIAAHRALSLNPNVSKVSQRQALKGLKIGSDQDWAQMTHRTSSRWGNNAPVSLLNDFDYLLQALFAEQTNRSLETHNKARAGDRSEPVATKFEVLSEAWHELLPHRDLHITGDDIQVSISGSSNLYSAADMSDGERATFYILGQVLVADEGSLLIFDEPELHVHKSIMSKLWDKLEALRPDCAFLFITHDLEFASSRVADKYVITSYNPQPFWEIGCIPQDTGFDEQLVTLIMGSRKPILFVEGNYNSLDLMTYRSCYPEWTVIPRGSCEQVIHSVVTMRQNSELTRVLCSGIVDADDYSSDDIEYLDGLGIKVIPVSEVENIFLLPSVSRAILELEGYSGVELTSKHNLYCTSILKSINDKQIEDVVLRHSKRRIDRALKKVDLTDAKSVEELSTVLGSKLSELDISTISNTKRQGIQDAVTKHDLSEFLKHFDNKGLLALAATNLKGCRLAHFEQWLSRVLSQQADNVVKRAIKAQMPEVEAC